ncbi:MAG: flagellar biosynthesis protein FlhB [Treponema sp.]|nr:flagellar biosynthesis protein FlhB [Treponema sp.]
MSFEQIDLQWFAAEDEGRTEEPSEYKLRKAREEGRIAKSSDLNSSIVFFFALMTLFVLAKRILIECADVMRFFFNHINDGDVKNASYFYIFAEKFAKIVVPVALTGVVFGIAGNIIQNQGFIFSTKAIEPKFSKILPNFAQYFKNTLFSFKGIFNVLKSIGKVFLIIAISFFLIRKDIPVLLMEIQNKSIVQAVFSISRMIGTILVVTAVLFIVIAVPDYFVQKREFMESMKMTKFEVKQEYKEMEGDPEVKSRIRQRAMQMARQNIPKAVSESDVVITNPTHFAVSLKYDTEATPAPQITAKGEDEIALMMRRIASENSVPIVENKPMARELYTRTEVGDIIPEDYFQIIAQIYAEVVKFAPKK